MIVESVLGPDLRQLNNQIYFRNGGDGDQFAWHQDICFRTPPEDFSGIESSYLQTIIVVDGLIPRDNSEKGLRKFERNGIRGITVYATQG